MFDERNLGYGALCLYGLWAECSYLPRNRGGRCTVASHFEIFLLWKLAISSKEHKFACSKAQIITSNCRVLEKKGGPVWWGGGGCLQIS